MASAGCLGQQLDKCQDYKYNWRISVYSNNDDDGAITGLKS